MPVSPRDYELYSRMTGAPIPMNAQQRMEMAPEVFNFTRNFAKKPNLLEKSGNLLKNLGNTALMGFSGAALAPALGEEQQIAETEQVQGNNQPEMSEKMQIELEKTKREKIKNEGRENLVRMQMEGAGSGIQMSDLNEDSTTADNYGQPLVGNQTNAMQNLRTDIQAGDIGTEETISENLTQGQDFTPKKSVEEIEANLSRDMEIAGEIKIGGPANLTEKVDKFLTQPGLDPVLLSVLQNRNQQEELEATAFQIASPLGDNPQTLPGETNQAVSQPFAKTIEPISNPSPNLTPEMKSVLDTLAKGRADLTQDQRMNIARKIVSPNELAGKDQATFEALTGSPSQQQLIEASQARSRVEQKTAAKQRASGMKTKLTEQYYPSDVARSDIQVGGMVDSKTGLPKSVGISYTPLNGDTQVGFNIMKDPTNPTDYKNTQVFDFVASPKTIESIGSKKEGELGALSYGKLFNIAKQRKQGFGSIGM